VLFKFVELITLFVFAKNVGAYPISKTVGDTKTNPYGVPYVDPEKAAPDERTTFDHTWQSEEIATFAMAELLEGAIKYP
jgi:hypothetical protein